VVSRVKVRKFTRLKFSLSPPCCASWNRHLEITWPVASSSNSSNGDGDDGGDDNSSSGPNGRASYFD
jgi:hypothetical protein